MILILTCADDPTADAVTARLDHRSVPFVRADIGDFPIRLRLVAATDDGGWNARLVADEWAVDLAEVTAVYYRRPSAFMLPAHVDGPAQVVAREEARLGFGGVLAAATRAARWVNDPVRIARAEYKPIGLQVAAEVGLRTPRTLITNDHSEVVRFAEDLAGGVVLFKQLSSISTRDALGPLLTYATPVQVDKLASEAIATTAHLFQEWVPKQFEVRLTMVGTAAYAASIYADSDRARVDWRADYGNLRYSVVDVPTEIAGACTDYLAEFGLSFGAFDFIVTPAGGWVFLECNPHGQWLWIENETGLPIASALADLLDGKANL